MTVLYSLILLERLGKLSVTIAGLGLCLEVADEATIKGLSSGGGAGSAGVGGTGLIDGRDVGSGTGEGIRLSKVDNLDRRRMRLILRSWKN